MYEPLEGKKFGRLYVTSDFRVPSAESGKNARKTASGHFYVRYRYFCSCVCACGNEKVVRRDSLLAAANPTMSCGCLSREALLKGRRGTHGKSETKAYRAWLHCKERCYLKSCKKYPRYGGRGIAVCDRWRDSFENFYADMGDPPSENHSLGRINNDKDYSPDNCRWETVAEQMNNTSRSKFIAFDGRIQTLSQWSRELGVKTGTLRRRLIDLEMPLEKAMQKILPKRKSDPASGDHPKL